MKMQLPKGVWIKAGGILLAVVIAFGVYDAVVHDLLTKEG